MIGINTHPGVFITGNIFNKRVTGFHKGGKFFGT